MKINSKSYPHPVLGNGDDLGGEFKVEFTYQLGRDTIELRPLFALNNVAIEDMLKKGKASYVTEVSCRRTFYRTSFASREREQNFSIPAERLREQVTVGFYVCADQDIRGYKPSQPHKDYDNALFDVDSGDVLAVGGQASFIAEKSFDPLRPPVSSFMSIMEGSIQEGPMQIDYDNEKITIVLSKEDWRNYLEVRKQKQLLGILHSAIVLPALADSIYQVRNSSAEYSGLNWFGRLQAILESKKLEEKDPLEAAQKILDHPIARGLKGMETIINEEDEKDFYE
ncbi:hypothetical protein HGA34_05810 [Candidatus Falkowbacteria bacterium]|nr:hypothetical protein [Candidatus Falkowbacteria bacterium]